MKHWKPILIVVLLMLSGLVFLWPAPDEPDMTEEQVMQAIANSHVEGNVPEEKDFQAFLTRDLNLYFGSPSDKSPVKGLEMLRNGPTQVGISSPKYYVWVTFLDGRAAAVKVAAEKKQGFQILQVFFASDIRQNRSVMDGELPPPVIEAALQKVP